MVVYLKISLEIKEERRSILSVVFRLSDSLAFGSLLTGYVLLYNKSPHSIVYRLITFGGLPRQIF